MLGRFVESFKWPRAAIGGVVGGLITPLIYAGYELGEVLNERMDECDIYFYADDIAQNLNCSFSNSTNLCDESFVNNVTSFFINGTNIIYPQFIGPYFQCADNQTINIIVQNITAFIQNHAPAGIFSFGINLGNDAVGPGLELVSTLIALGMMTGVTVSVLIPWFKKEYDYYHKMKGYTSVPTSEQTQDRATNNKLEEGEASTATMPVKQSSICTRFAEKFCNLFTEKRKKKFDIKSELEQFKLEQRNLT